jgi:hypothetical protein
MRARQYEGNDYGLQKSREMLCVLKYRRVIVVGEFFL